MKVNGETFSAGIRLTRLTYMHLTEGQTKLKLSIFLSAPSTLATWSFLYYKIGMNSSFFCSQLCTQCLVFSIPGISVCSIPTKCCKNLLVLISQASLNRPLISTLNFLAMVSRLNSECRPVFFCSCSTCLSNLASISLKYPSTAAITSSLAFLTIALNFSLLSPIFSLSLTYIHIHKYHSFTITLQSLNHCTYSITQLGMYGFDGFQCRCCALVQVHFGVGTQALRAKLDTAEFSVRAGVLEVQKTVGVSRGWDRQRRCEKSSGVLYMGGRKKYVWNNRRNSNSFE